MTNDEIANMTGAGIYGKRFSVSEITFNGNTGDFMYRDKDAQKNADGKYPKENLGKSLDIVFLKIRRKLSVFKKNGNGLSTNEHNSKNDMVVVYGPNNLRDIGTASAMREKYHELRTQQMVYCYYPAKKEIVRIVIKGASLGSEVKHPADVNKFYDYLQTFSKEEPVHTVFTKLSPIKEAGPQGDYYAIRFDKGATLAPEQQEKINSSIIEVHTAILESDTAFREKMNLKGKDVELDEMDEEDTIQMDEHPLDAEFNTPSSPEVPYPDDEINPEDIPF